MLEFIGLSGGGINCEVERPKEPRSQDIWGEAKGRMRIFGTMLNCLIIGMSVLIEPALAQAETKPGLLFETIKPDAGIQIKMTSGKVVITSVHEDLLARIAKDDINEVDLLTIERELEGLTGTVYVPPAKSDDLLVAIDLPKGLSSEKVDDESIEEVGRLSGEQKQYVDIHIQLVLKVQPVTARYLTSVLEKADLLPHFPK